jgi:hypothetical protein
MNKLSRSLLEMSLVATRSCIAGGAPVVSECAVIHGRRLGNNLSASGLFL